MSWLTGIFNLIAIIRRLVEWWVRERAKQEGREEVAHDVTRETAEAENRMHDVPRPSDDAVTDKLQRGEF